MRPALLLLVAIALITACDQAILPEPDPDPEPEPPAAELHFSVTEHVTYPGPGKWAESRIRFRGTAPGVATLFHEEWAPEGVGGVLVSRIGIPLSDDSVRTFEHWHAPKWRSQVLVGYDFADSVVVRGSYHITSLGPSLALSPSPEERFVVASADRIDLILHVSARSWEDVLERVEVRVGDGEPTKLAVPEAKQIDLDWSPALSPEDVTWLTVRVETAVGHTRTESFPIARALPPQEPGDYIDIAAGPSSTCAVATGGAARCWGSHLYWNPADPEGLSTRPTGAHPSLRFSAIEGGEYAICGLDDAGAAYCWGKNLAGHLGDGTHTDRSVPTPVMGDLSFRQLSVGNQRTCGIAIDGAAWCWGRKAAAHLDPAAPDSPTPVAVPGGISFRDISAEYLQVCGLGEAGEVYCWDGETFPSPRRVETNVTFTDVAVTNFRICALDNAGDPWCWRRNPWEFPVFTRYATGLGLNSLTSGSDRICGLTTGGTAYCWDDDLDAEPVRVESEVEFSSLAAADHICGLTANGAAFCWGGGRTGQLGNLTRYDLASPIRVAEPMP